MSTASAMEEPVSRSKGSCTVPLASSKLEPKKADGKKELTPLIVIHELLGSQMTDRSLAKRKDFAPHREVYTVDLRNHGQSPKVSEMDLRAMSRDLIGFLDNEGIEKASVLGHSMGGKVAMILALEQPELVNELIVLDSLPMAGGDKLHALSSVVQIMHDIDMENFRNKKDIEQALKDSGVEDDRLRQFVMSNVVSDDKEPGFYKWKVNIQAIHDSFPALTDFPKYDSKATFSGPSLFVQSDANEEFQKQQLEAIRPLFPKAEIKAIKKVSHWLQAEEPEEFCSVVNSFLGDSA